MNITYNYFIQLKMKKVILFIISAMIWTSCVENSAEYKKLKSENEMFKAEKVVGHLLSGRHFLRELDFSAEEWGSLLDLAGELKAAKRSGCEVRRLVGRNITLVFEKTSTRTRC